MPQVTEPAVMTEYKVALYEAKFKCQLQLDAAMLLS